MVLGVAAVCVGQDEKSLKAGVVRGRGAGWTEVALGRAEGWKPPFEVLEELGEKMRRMMLTLR